MHEADSRSVDPPSPSAETTDDTDCEPEADASRNVPSSRLQALLIPGAVLLLAILIPLLAVHGVIGLYLTGGFVLTYVVIIVTNHGQHDIEDRLWLVLLLGSPLTWSVLNSFSSPAAIQDWHEQRSQLLTNSAASLAIFSCWFAAGAGYAASSVPLGRKLCVLGIGTCIYVLNVGIIHLRTGMVLLPQLLFTLRYQALPFYAGFSIALYDVHHWKAYEKAEQARKRAYARALAAQERMWERARATQERFRNVTWLSPLRSNIRQLYGGNLVPPSDDQVETWSNAAVINGEHFCGRRTDSQRTRTSPWGLGASTDML